MLIINFNPYPVLETDRLILRNISLDDKDDLFIIRSDKEAMRYVPRPMAVTVEDVLPLIEVIQQSSIANERINWTITEKGVDKLIGMVGFVGIAPQDYRAEVGYILNPAYQGKGIMREAFKAVMDYGFDVMKLNSVEAVINPANIASQKVVENYGFTKDAYFKDYIYHNDKFIDALVYSCITPHK